MQDIFVSILVNLVWLAVAGIIVYYGLWFYGKLIEKDESGWDMFCEEHYKEAMEHIQNKYPTYSVGYDEVIRDEEFDNKESLACGYPACIKESKYEIYWMKFVGFRGSKSYTSPLWGQKSG